MEFQEMVPEDIEALLTQINFGIIENAQKTQNIRFADITATDVDDFLASEVNVNTKKKTDQNIRVFREFLESKGEFRELADIAPSELSTFISMFLLSVRKKDGGEYEPTTLRGFVSSIQRILKSQGYRKSLTDDIEFSKMQETLKLKQKSLKALGKGNKPKAADELTDTHLEVMYRAKTIGPYTPRSLIHSMWLVCTLHFGMRTGNECHNLKWGDVTIKSDENDDTYLLYDVERQTKTRTGANARSDFRSNKPRAYAIPNNPERDPVALFKLYGSKRPASMLEEGSPFFLAVNDKRVNDDTWYKQSPMGINKFYSIMKDMKAGTDIEGNTRITPYSARKHLVQKLNDEGLPPNQIIQITGHKNLNSLNNYSHLNSHLNSHQHKKASYSLSDTNNSLALAMCPQSKPSCTVSRPPSSDGFPSSSQVTNYSSTDHRNILSSLLSGNTINGNVTINITPDCLRQCADADDNHSRGEKRALED